MLNKNRIQEAVMPERTLVNFRSRALAETAAVMVVTLLAPILLAHTANNQWIVGPLVNAGLFWLAFRVGIGNAILIAFLPSLIALFRGMLPPQTVALIPFIILGNTALIVTANYLSKKPLIGVLAASTIKALLIMTPAFLILPKASLAFIFAGPQLVTALLGGGIYLLVSRKIR